MQGIATPRKQSKIKLQVICTSFNKFRQINADQTNAIRNIKNRKNTETKSPKLRISDENVPTGNRLFLKTISVYFFKWNCRMNIPLYLIVH